MFAAETGYESLQDFATSIGIGLLFSLNKLKATQTTTSITLATLSNLAFKTGRVVAIGGAALARRTLPGLAAIAAGLVGGLLSRTS